MAGVQRPAISALLLLFLLVCLHSTTLAKPPDRNALPQVQKPLTSPAKSHKLENVLS
jgi:hypothetical protein